MIYSFCIEFTLYRTFHITTIVNHLLFKNRRRPDVTIVRSVSIDLVGNKELYK